MSRLLQSLACCTAPSEGWRFDAPGSCTNTRLFWRLQLGCWGVVGVGGFLLWSGVVGAEIAAFAAVVRVMFALIGTCVLREIYRRISWRGLSPWMLFAGVVVLCALLTLVETAISKNLLFAGVKTDIAPEVVPVMERVMRVLRFSCYAGWSLVYLALRIWNESIGAQLHAARCEAAVRTAEVRQLQAQVNPHFLFNALNSILAEKDNAPAVERITTELANYLRYALRAQDDVAPLGTELDVLERYLRVEKNRFEERLVYTIEAGPAARAVRVPAALVQPLLENALKYGRKTGPRILSVGITAAVEDDALCIRVTNTGSWIEFDPAASHGIGVSNLRRRLELLSNGRATLDHASADGVVTATVRWPVERANIETEVAA